MALVLGKQAVKVKPKLKRERCSVSETREGVGGREGEGGIER